MSIQLTAGGLTELLERYRARVLEFDQVALRRSASSAPTTLPLVDDGSDNPTVRELEVLDSTQVERSESRPRRRDRLPTRLAAGCSGRVTP
jgi:hypothetical protein